MARTYTEGEVQRLIQEAVAPLHARIAELEGEIARLKKDSSTSSKPPSSDIVKPPPPPPSSGKRKGKRRRGGQKGHPRHTRPVFPPEQVDTAWLYEWEQSSLGQDWEPLDEFRTIQQVDLVEKLFEVTEHRARLYRHVCTGKVVAAPLPREVLEAGLLGPRLSALVGYQKGACHMSYTSIQGFLGGVLHLEVSRGQLAKAVQKVSAALSGSYEELKAALLKQRVVNVDETGHPENGEKLWTWDFHVPGDRGFTFFHIDPSRSSEVLKEFLGEAFGGVIGCDYLSAYRKFLKDTDATLQFCWAHLVRDVKFLTKLPDPVTRRYGERLLGTIKTLFHVWHRRGQTPDKRWKRDAQRAEQAVLKVARRPPQRTDAQNIAQRFRDHGKYYFMFLRTPGVEPTNNAAERAFRFVVIDRRITQGTRGENGRRWCERIWSVVATCAQRGRSAFDFILQSVVAHFQGLDAPSLLALPP